MDIFGSAANVNSWWCSYGICASPGAWGGGGSCESLCLNLVLPPPVLYGMPRDNQRSLRADHLCPCCLFFLHIGICFCVAPGLKKALSAAALVLARANDADRTLTLKRIRSKSVEVTLEHRLLDQIVPADPPGFESPMVRWALGHDGTPQRLDCAPCGLPMC